jgi:ribonuclease HI
VKAHSGIAGNEYADAMAKHFALHNGEHDVHFQNSQGLQRKAFSQEMRLLACS